jgi:hypothetical protein
MPINPSDAFAVRWCDLCKRYPDLAKHKTPRLSPGEFRMLCEEFYRRGALDSPKLDLAAFGK